MNKASRAFLLGSALSAAVLTGLSDASFAQESDAQEGNNVRITDPVTPETRESEPVTGIEKRFGRKLLKNGCFIMEGNAGGSGGLVIPAQVICPIVKIP